MKRARRQHLDDRRYLRVAMLALAFLYLIVITGATVRLTGSGLGCPDWPSCHGARPVPELEYHGVIEFFNRLVSFPTLVLSIASFVFARRLERPRRGAVLGSAAVLAGVCVQIVLGGLTVRMGLNPWVVSAHFLMSIVILAFATWTVFCVRHEPGLRRARASHVLQAGALLATCAVAVVTGVLTTASGPHSGATAGSAVQRIGVPVDAVELHAHAVFVFAGLVLALTALRRRSWSGGRDLLALSGLVVVQIFIGELQYRTGLPWQVVLAHVATATLIWIVTCWICFSLATRGGRSGLRAAQGDDVSASSNATAALKSGDGNDDAREHLQLHPAQR